MSTVTEVAEHGVCPGCGAGKGRQHYERCHVQSPAYPHTVPHRDVIGLTAYAIAVFPMEIVRRSTIRALLPRGKTVNHPTAEEKKAGKVSRNTTSAAFMDGLKNLERKGWIRRGPDYIIITARLPLLRYARSTLRASPYLMAAVHKAAGVIAASLPPGVTVAEQSQREAELRALQRLMEAAPATGPHSGRGHTDLVHKPRMI